MQIMKNGYFVISLDFELLWGVFDVEDYSKKLDYFDQTLEVIPKILQMFQSNQIHCTWATVGMLFNNNWEEWEANIPESLPAYTNSKLSAYNFGKDIKSDDTISLCFAPNLLSVIKKVPGQEIATHTYSHYYCLEEGQNRTQFRLDLERALKVAKEMNIKLESLVFPRNQFNSAYLEICKELGIKNVRSNPSSWYWKDLKSESLLNRLARTGDAYFSIGNKSYPFKEIEDQSSVPKKQKASRFLRPVEGNKLLRRLKLYQIKKELTSAAKNKEIYHLWWHPHNFGNNPVESLKDLSVILSHFQRCRELYGFESVNMQELGNLHFRSS